MTSLLSELPEVRTVPTGPCFQTIICSMGFPRNLERHKRIDRNDTAKKSFITTK